jgi:UTP-glucose-1-phosphate uridylyltransferase
MEFEKYCKSDHDLCRRLEEQNQNKQFQENNRNTQRDNRGQSQQQPQQGPGQQVFNIEHLGGSQ